MYPIKHHLQDTGPQVRNGVQRGKGLGNGKVLTAGLRSETSETSHAKVKEARSGSAGERGSQGVNRLGSESSRVSSRRWRVSPFIRQSSSFRATFPSARCMIRLESPVRENRTPGSVSGGRKRAPRSGAPPADSTDSFLEPSTRHLCESGLRVRQAN